jgi:hypothetical protein
MEKNEAEGDKRGADDRLLSMEPTGQVSLSDMEVGVGARQLTQ